MNRRTKGIAIGTLVAGAMGYIAGILTAPKSGSETRQNIRHVRDSSLIEVERQLKKLHTELNHLVGEAQHAAKHGIVRDTTEALEGEIISKATRTRQKTREILSALHDGNADDDDLDMAVSEAAKAIKSIRSYLKK